MLVVSLTSLVPRSELEPHLEAHYAFLDQYYDEGIFIASGPNRDQTGGVMIANGISRGELEIILTQDPFYQHKIADYKILEFVPTRGSYANVQST